MKLKTLKNVRAIFLDRDGTVCKDKGYSNRPEDLEIYQGVKEKLWQMKRYGFWIFLVTNQAGASLGYHTKEDIERFTRGLNLALGNVFDGIWYCHHPPQFECACRKPKTGLLDNALSQFPVSPSLSWMIGDKETDVKLGKLRKLKTILVLTGHGKKRFGREKPDFVSFDLPQALDIILNLVKENIKPFSFEGILGVVDFELEGFFAKDMGTVEKLFGSKASEIFKLERTLPIDIIIGLAKLEKHRKGKRIIQRYRKMKKLTYKSLGKLLDEVLKIDVERS